MADNYQPPIGGDLSAAISAAQALEAEARAAELSVKRAERAGDKLDEKEVKREAARKRVRERPYQRAASEPSQLNLDLDEELNARKAKNAEILAEEQRALTAQKRIADARRAEAAREARRKPYRLAEVTDTGKIKKVLSYYDDLAVAQRRAEGATYGGRRVIAQENPNFSPTIAARERQAAEAQARAARPPVVAPQPDVGLRAKTVVTPESKVALAQRDLAVQRALVAEGESALASRRANGQAFKDAERKLGIEKRREARMATTLANLQAEQATLAAQALAAERQVTEARLAQARNARALPAGRQPLQLPAAGQTGPGFQERGSFQRGPTAGRIFYGSPSGAPDERQYIPAGGTPPPPPPPPQRPTAAGGAADDSGAQQRRAQTLTTVAEHENAMAQGVQRSTRAIQQNTAVINANQNAYRQHGALTTEFIEAAARGETNYREWGYQIAATAAKFAGWTLVSVPVFAAIDGVRKIGQGAIDASTGVNQLQRVLDNVDAGQAQGAFRELSSQFNVPINEASQAVYLMGQRFHDLPSAVNAAKAVLYSFKTGDVPIEQSARNLTSVINGFGLSADALLPIFDKINNAQNEFGVSIDDTEQGLAKAAGSYKNAGGSVEYLLSLIASAKLATGRTGQNIGTALQRSVGFIQRPSNQAALQQYGIDTGQGIDQIYEQAFQKAKGLQGEQLQELATALSSPQYASYFVPLLQNYSNATSGFKKVLDSTLNDSSNSGAKELDRVLGSVRERISEIGNELQRFGSELAQVGAAAPFDILLRGLDAGLTTANQILEVFNKLPTGLKTAAVSAAELYGVLRLARRLGIGDALPGRVGQFLNPNPAAATRTAGLQALREDRNYLQTRVGTFAGRAREVQLNRRIAFAAEDAARDNFVLAKRGGNAKEIEAAQDRFLAANQHSADLAERADRLEAERVEVSRALNERRRQEAALRRTKDPVSFAEREGIVFSNDRNRATEQVGRIEDGAFRAYPTQPSRILDRLKDDPSSASSDFASVGQQRVAYIKAVEEAAAAEDATRAGRQRAALRRLGGSTRDSAGAFNALRRESGTLGAAFTTASGAASGAGDGIKRAASAGKARLGAAMSNLRQGIAGMFGPLDILLIGGLAAYEIGKRGLDKRTQEANRLDRLASERDTASSVDAQRRRGQDDIQNSQQSGVPYLRRVPGVNLIPGVGQRTNLDQLGRGIQEANRAATIEETNAKLDARGKPRVFVGSGDVLARLKEIQGQFSRGALTIAQRRKALDTLLAETANITDSGRVATRSKVQEARLNSAPPKGMIAQLFGTSLGVNATSGDVLQKNVESYTTIVSGVNATSKQIRTLTAEVLAKLSQLSTSTSPEYQAQIAPLIQSTAQGIAQGAQAELDQALLFSRSRDERQKAYAAYARRLNSGGGVFNQAKGQLNRRLASVDARLKDAKATPDASNTGEASFITNYIQDSQRDSRIKALRQGRKAIEGQIKNVARSNRALRQQLRLLQEEQRRAEYQDNEAFRDAETQVTAAGLPAGLGRARFLLSAIGGKIQRAIRQYGRNSTEVLTLVNQQQEAANSVVQEQADLLQAQGALAEANAGTNENAQADARVGGLRKQLAFMRAHPEVYKPADLVNLQAQIAQAQNDTVEKAKEKVADILKARYEFLESKTDDPVTIARLEYQLSQKVVQRGGFKNQAEKYRALAERNKNKRNFSQTKQQSTYDDIEFYASIGKYTTDQEVAALRGLEKTLKNNKKLKREIQQRIYSLTHSDQNDGELDLNLNNIRLPTLYEIRRASQSQAGGTSITNRNSATIVVNNPTDVPAVARAMETHNTGIGRAAARAMGVR